MKNAIAVVGRELIDKFSLMVSTKEDHENVGVTAGELFELIYMTKDLIEINVELTKREQKYKGALNHLVQSCEINTGNEPSLSCYHRALDEAKQALKGDSDE